MFKRLLAMLLTLMLCVGMLPGTMMTASAATITGTTGNCTWIFDDSTGVLTISGNGAMAGYSSSNNPPWASYKDSIKKVVINEGVTSIGSYAFSQYPALTEVFIPGSISAIGNNAFYSCTNLKTVEYWGITAPNASSNVFFGVYSTIKVPANYSSSVFCGKMARQNLGEIDSTATYDINVSASPAEGGTVTGAGTYHAGKAAITAAANPGYRFVEWKENDAQISTDSTYILTANRNYSIVAVFEKETAAPTTYAVYIDSDITGGTVAADKDEASPGETVTLTVTPDDGYELDVLSVTDKDGGDVPVTDGVFTMPGSNINVTATFKKTAAAFSIKLDAVDASEGIHLPGVNMVVTIGDDMKIASFSSSDGVYTLSGLAPNTTYTLSSQSEPSIFLWPKPVSFSFSDDGAIRTAGALTEDGTLLLMLEPACVSVKCIDSETGNAVQEFIPVEIKNSTGTVILAPTLCDLSTLTYLPTGEMLTLHVTDAGEYELPEDILFVIDQVGYVNTSASIDENGVILIQLKKKTPTYTVTVKPSDHGAATVSPATFTEGGSTITVNVVPNEGYVIKEVNPYTSDGTSLGTASRDATDPNKFTFVAPACDVTVELGFEAEAKTYTVTLLPSTNGTVTADRTTGLKEGDEVTLTVTPEEGYKLDTLSVKQGDTDVPVTDNQFTMPAGPVKVNATFKSTSYRFNMQLKLVDPDGNALSVYGTAYLEGSGTVHTSEAMIRTLSEGSHTLAFSFSITGYVNPENAVLNVDADGNLTSGSSHVAIQKDGDVYYVVVTPAKVAAYPITANITGSGTAEITRNGNAITEAVEGAYVLVYVTPDEDSQLYRVLFNDADITGQFTQDGLGFRYVFPMPDEAVTLDVVFIDIYHVTFDANGGEGTMSPQDFVYGESQHLAKNTFTRNGYTFAGWSLNPNGTTIDAGDEMSVLVYADLTLYAVWKPAEPSDALPPDILTPAEPMTVTVREGETAKFSVQAVNAETYQWFVDYNDGTGWHIISAGSDTCTTAPTKASDNGNRYICVVTGEDDQMAESPVFTLEVLPKIVVPETGDSFQLGLWLALSCISGAGMMALKLSRRNRKNR